MGGKYTGRVLRGKVYRPGYVKEPVKKEGFRLGDFSRAVADPTALNLLAGPCLYRYVDPDDVLLYAGITSSLMGRMRQHMSSAWGHPVFKSRIFVTFFTTIELARAAEQSVLIWDKPLLYLAPRDFVYPDEPVIRSPVHLEITALVYGSPPRR